MTRDEIMALEAGRELDARIAEMLGYQVFERHGYHYMATDKAAFEQGMEYGLFMEDFTHPDEMRLCQRLEHYSISITPAWKVLEMLHSQGNFVSISLDNDGPNQVWINNAWGDVPATIDVEVTGDEVPLIICQAALLTRIGR